MYLNEDLIENIAERPDTRITLANGNRYIVLEHAGVLLGRIVSFKASVLRRATSGGSKRLKRLPA
jgi:flagellar protein FlbD